MLPSGRKWGFGRLKRLAIKRSLEARNAFLEIHNLISLILITRKIIKFREFCASETREEIISRMSVIFHFLLLFFLFDGNPHNPRSFLEIEDNLANDLCLLFCIVFS
jgi:hypothetical protein